MLTYTQQKYDEAIVRAFKKGDYWGISTLISLTKCNDRSISDSNMIAAFAIQLCDALKMKRYGEPQVVYFGQDEKVSGYTLIQLIETSSITGHFAVGNNCSAYIDIFSCKEYLSYSIAEFCKEYFGAEKFTIGVTLRR